MNVKNVWLGRTTPRVFLSAVMALAGASALAGCPIFPDDDCRRGWCSDPTPDERQCVVSSDCGSGYVCTSAGRCEIAASNPACGSSAECANDQTCGRDNYCHDNDCTLVGCASGTCLLASGVATCVEIQGPVRDAAPDGSADASDSSTPDGGDGGDGGANGDGGN